MFLRRLKAILVNATVWAVAWAAAGIVAAVPLAWQVSTGEHAPAPFLEMFTGLGTAFGLIAAATGFIGGTLFSIGLMMAERDRGVDELSRKRVALLGLIGGTIIPFLIYLRFELVPHAHVPTLLSVVLLGGAAALGAISATAALAAAQRGKQVSAGTESDLLGDGITSAKRHGRE